MPSKPYMPPPSTMFTKCFVPVKYAAFWPMASVGRLRFARQNAELHLHGGVKLDVRRVFLQPAEVFLIARGDGVGVDTRDAEAVL